MPALSAHHSPSTVLVVEDQDIIRTSIADYLRADGFDIIEANSGSAAQAIFEANPSIDIVFTDIQMAAQMDGLALAYWVHENHPAVPVLLASGLVTLPSLPDEICAPGSRFSKPYECSAVASRIRALLAPS